MPTYRLVYGDDEVVQTLENVVIEQEDGWVVFFRGLDVILRVHESHVCSLEIVDG
jgi:hypothetical protein